MSAPEGKASSEIPTFSHLYSLTATIMFSLLPKVYTTLRHNLINKILQNYFDQLLILKATSEQQGIIYLWSCQKVSDAFDHRLGRAFVTFDIPFCNMAYLSQPLIVI